MSISYYVQGIKPPDETWKRMKSVYDACVAADIDVPDEVQRYFDWSDPDEKGVVIRIEHKDWSDHDSGREGYEVDLTRLPKDVKILRFVISV